MDSTQIIDNSILTQSTLKSELKKNKKPPKGWYFGDYSSSFENEIRYRKLYPGVGSYNVDLSAMNKSNCYKKKTKNIPQSNRFKDPKFVTPGPNAYNLDTSVTQSLRVSTDNGSYSRYQNTEDTILKNNQSNIVELSKFANTSNINNTTINNNEEQQQQTNKKKRMIKAKSELMGSTFSQSIRNTSRLNFQASELGPGQYNIESEFGKNFEKKAPNFELQVDRQHLITDNDIPGVGTYTIEGKNETNGFSVAQSARNTKSLFMTKFQESIPGVGTYTPTQYNISQDNPKNWVGTKMSQAKKFQRMDGLEALKEKPGPASYDNSNLADYKFHKSRIYTIPKYQGQDQELNDAGPSPHDYGDRADIYDKPVSIPQSKRPDYELMKKTPGVGAYTIAGEMYLDPNRHKHEVTSISPQLQKVLIQKKEIPVVEDEYGNTRLQNRRVTYVKNIRLADIAQRQNLEQKEVQHMLRKKMTYAEIQDYISPNIGTYTAKSTINSPRIVEGQNTMGSANRKLQYLDIYNKPEFGTRSQGPAEYSKIDTIEIKGMVSIPQAQKVSFIPPPRIKPGVGDYNSVEFSTFGKYKKQQEKRKELDQLDSNKRTFVMNLDMKNKLNPPGQKNEGQQTNKPRSQQKSRNQIGDMHNMHFEDEN